MALSDRGLAQYVFTYTRRLRMNAQPDEKPTDDVLDAPICYIERSRAYYLVLGYDNPYRWAHNEDAPFAPMQKPVSACRVVLITTAAPLHSSRRRPGPMGPIQRLRQVHRSVQLANRTCAGPQDQSPRLRPETHFG